MNMPFFHKLSRPREILHDTAQSVVGVHWGYLGIAFFLAVFLWYTVTVRDKVDSWVDVRVEFKGTPNNLVIRDGLINKVSVQLRAAAGLMRSVSNSRNLSVTLDLSHIVKGMNVLQITPSMLSFPNAFEVMEISPQRIQIVADSIESRSMPLESSFAEALSGDLFVKSLRLSPQAVTVKGPEALINSIRSVKIPVPLGGITRSGSSTIQVAVPVPATVTVEPAQVAVELEVGVRTKTVRLTRGVSAALPVAGKTVKITPSRVIVNADIPESQAGNADVLGRVLATVAIPQDMQNGTHKLPVNVLLPDQASLSEVSPKEVTVTISNK